MMKPLKTFLIRHCEGDSPKPEGFAFRNQSGEIQYSGLLHYVRNDVKTEFLEVPFPPQNSNIATAVRLNGYF